ncbi:mediator of RNA polymerase II transcription subunit 16 [Stachybotrys elegans]|uniref:Mediator of RNA polymerase II transcription subunit 16 n=1 Tax=Stachybotrys elegans TaxID=80388 RepID=A0A8K0SZQ6_9HYPO|nr:mediator of RNA polymerase II transcription subunit 16 [Stachybotrys elegans]
MTANKMPLMLDGTIPVDLNDVDDLFGEGVGLPLSVRSQSKQLRQRVDELRNKGCCQTIAWSKVGTIASISSDGLTVEFRYLRFLSETASWDLSEPTTCQHVKGTSSVPLVHLEWSPANHPDLAIIDALGRVTLVTFAGYLNQPFVSRSWDADPVDDMYSVVGCHWLAVTPAMLQKQQAYNILYGPANKHGNAFQYESSFVHITGPVHPAANKSALLCVTTGGMLKMFWPQLNNKIEETTMELESVNSSADLVTHAAMASDRKSLLLAMATSSSQLSLVKIDIMWAGAGAQHDKSAPLPPGTRLSPSLIEKHLATTTWIQNGQPDMSDASSAPDLTNLHVLPAMINSTGKNIVPPVVVAIRIPASTAPYGGSQTVIDRWEAVEQKQGVHSAFEQLGNRRNSVSSEPPSVTQLRKLDPIVLDRVLINFHTIHFGKVVVLTFADSSVEYRDRFTFEEIYNSEDLMKVTVLRQAGWAYNEDRTCQQVAYSPTQCSMVQIGDDGKLVWSKLQYTLDDMGSPAQDGHYRATLAALAIATASATWTQSNYDDLLAIVRPHLDTRRFIQDWLMEFIRICKIQIDYSEEVHHESLMRNMNLQSCLGIMHNLGFVAESGVRSFQSTFAKLELDLRNVDILITLASNTPFREKMSPLDDPEVVEALAGCTKWALDLFAWLVDSLCNLSRDDKFMELLVPARYSEMTPYLKERNEVAMHLMLASSSRSFLLVACRRVAHLELLSARAIDFYRKNSAGSDTPTANRGPTPQLLRAYQKMQQVIAASLIRANDFEKLLSSVGADVKQTYQESLPNLVKQQPNAPQGKQLDMAVKAAQASMETAMLLGQSPPPPFLHMIQKFFRDLMAFRKLTDPAKLFFADYDLLQIRQPGEAPRAPERLYADMFRRVFLRPDSGRQWRRCSRCAAVMEDLTATRPGFIFVLNQQRKCSCGGNWAIMPKGKIQL